MLFSEISSMVLLGSRTGPKDFRGPKYNTLKQLQEIEEKDYYT